VRIAKHIKYILLGADRIGWWGMLVIAVFLGLFINSGYPGVGVILALIIWGLIWLVGAFEVIEDEENS